MTEDDLREAMVELFYDRLTQWGCIVDRSECEALTDETLSLEPIASALAQKAYAERMMGHSTGDR